MSTAANGGGEPRHERESTEWKGRLRPRALALRSPVPGEGLPPYAHVLLDVLGGTSARSVGDEAEQPWRVVAPVLVAWEGGEVPLEEYPAGSVGSA